MPRVADLIKRPLSALMSIQVEKGYSTVRRLSGRLSLSMAESRDAITKLVKKGYVRKVGSKIYLTDLGRGRLKVVMTGGVFDLIHMGHMATLEGARRLGDMLVVVVARDVSAQRTKGRSPINDEASRLRIVRSLKPVDAAILGDRHDMYRVTQLIRPDVIALGYDQKHDEAEMAEELRRRGMPTRIKRLRARVPGAKTSNILTQIGSESCPQKCPQKQIR